MRSANLVFPYPYGTIFTNPSVRSAQTLKYVVDSELTPFQSVNFNELSIFSRISKSVLLKDLDKNDCELTKEAMKRRIDRMFKILFPKEFRA